jgi:hypothetical protein
MEDFPFSITLLLNRVGRIRGAGSSSSRIHRVNTGIIRSHLSSNNNNCGTKMMERPVRAMPSGLRLRVITRVIIH